MTLAVDPPVTTLPDTPVRGSVLRRLLRNPLGLVSVVVLAVLLAAALLAPVLAPYGQNEADVAQTLAGPGGQHLLGTDSAGRDVLSRLLFGARLTLLSALLCAAVAIAIGLPSGLLAGYFGGLLDSVPGWFAGLFMSLPGIIVLLSVRAALGPSVWISMIVFGVLISPGYYRLTRTAVQSVRNELYVDAARVSGLSDARIIARHVLSVVRAPLIIQTAMVCGVAIAIQSGLEFLGLGDPAKATWGVMLSDAFRNIYLAPLTLLWPALAVGVSVGALVLLGNALRDAYEDGADTAPRRRALRAGSTPAGAAVRSDPAGDLDDDEPAPGTLLRVQHLAVAYPRPDGSSRTVVHDVSLTVARGEVLGLVGESGSGKSQTAFSVLGLLPRQAQVTAGRIDVAGVRTLRPGGGRIDQDAVARLRGRSIAYVPQEPMSNLDPAYTIGSQLTTPVVRVAGASRAQAQRRALDLLASVGIADPRRTFDAYPHEISGGMAQRVLIAGALSCDPDLIVADEPTTALDVTVQAEVLDILRTLRDERGVGILLVTHNIGVVADLADRVAVMQHGRVVETGPVREVLTAPAHPYTRTLLGSMVHGREPMTPLTRASAESAGDPASTPEEVR